MPLATKSLLRVASAARSAFVHSARPLRTSFPNNVRAFSQSIQRHAEGLPHSEFPPKLAPNDTPEDFMYRKLMGKAVSLIEVNSLEQARDAFEEARKIKETPLVFYNLGVVSFQLKNLSQSIAHFEKSLQLDPNSADAHSCHNNLATCYIFGTPPNTEKGIEHLKKAVELKPQDGEVRFNLGAVLESAGHIEDAYRQYFAAKELGVSQAEPHMRNAAAKILRMKVEEKQDK